MISESIAEALPLKEAVTYWTTSGLADAVFVAESAFTEEQRDLQQRKWLFEIIHRRQHRDPPPMEAPSPDVQRLRQAWQEMFVHFSTGVAYGEITLWGRLAKPLARAHQERLSFKRAKHLLYHPRTNTILDENATYWDVVATRSGVTANWESRARDLRIAAGEVPLATALREWTDPTLISQVCHLERQHTEHQLTGLATLMVLSDLEDLAQPTNGSWMGGPSDSIRLLSAQEALVDDFRARLVGGEFHLKGVMAKPRREQQPETLPGVWAADFALDFRRGTLAFDAARYVAVTAAYGAAAETAVTNEDARHGPQCEPGGQVSSAVPEEQKRRPPGRKGAGTVIEAALSAYWDELFPGGAPAKPDYWIELARKLIRCVQRAPRQPGVGFPAEDTVRKHLPTIYVQLLGEKGGPPQSAQ